MASDTFLIKLNPDDTGLSLIAKFFNKNGTAATGDITSGFSELANGEYFFTTTVIPDGFDGYLTIITEMGYQTSLAYKNTATLDSLSADLDTANAALEALASDVSGIASDVADVQLTLNSITSGDITITSPLISSTELQLIRGDSYPAGVITFSLASPSLVGSTVVFSAKNKQTGVTDLHNIACTVSNAGASDQAINLVLTSTQTSNLTLGEEAYYFDLQATTSGIVRTILRGTINVLEDYS